MGLESWWLFFKVLGLGIRNLIISLFLFGTPKSFPKTQTLLPLMMGALESWWPRKAIPTFASGLGSRNLKTCVTVIVLSSSAKNTTKDFLLPFALQIEVLRFFKQLSIISEKTNQNSTRIIKIRKTMYLIMIAFLFPSPTSNWSSNRNRKSIRKFELDSDVKNLGYSRWGCYLVFGIWFGLEFNFSFIFLFSCLFTFYWKTSGYGPIALKYESKKLKW